MNALNEIARAKNASASQIAIAWVMSRGADIVPLIGARRRTQLAESLKALDLKLTSEELSQIERAVPANAVAGNSLCRRADALAGQRKTRLSGMCFRVCVGTVKSL